VKLGIIARFRSETDIWNIIKFHCAQLCADVLKNKDGIAFSFEFLMEVYFDVPSSIRNLKFVQDMTSAFRKERCCVLVCWIYLPVRARRGKERSLLH
jgi:hypothetical protein